VDDTLLDCGKISKRFPLFDSLQPTVEFYRYVKDLGYRTVILTARNESRRETTIKNLQHIKITDYDDIIFRTKNDIDYSFAKYKLNQRKNLAKKYTIIANIGDQLSDFEGGYNGKIIKIPNY
jgi:predicted secreted acid phosphatase